MWPRLRGNRLLGASIDPESQMRPLAFKTQQRVLGDIESGVYQCHTPTLPAAGDRRDPLADEASAPIGLVEE